MSLEPLSQETISSVTRMFLDTPSCSAKLEWWLQRGHSCERWLQFEWAFLLQRALGDRFVVACEIDYVDVVCFRRPFDILPVWKNTPSAALEVKFYGNSWFDSVLC